MVKIRLHRYSDTLRAIISMRVFSAYLSGTRKLKCTDQKLTKSETQTCLVQMNKWKQEFQFPLLDDRDFDF